MAFDVDPISSSTFHLYSRIAMVTFRLTSFVKLYDRWKKDDYQLDYLGSRYTINSIIMTYVFKISETSEASKAA